MYIEKTYKLLPISIALEMFDNGITIYKYKDFDEFSGRKFGSIVVASNKEDLLAGNVFQEILEYYPNILKMEQLEVRKGKEVVSFIGDCYDGIYSISKEETSKLIEFLQKPYIEEN